jgi:hypothetical protein
LPENRCWSGKRRNRVNGNLGRKSKINGPWGPAPAPVIFIATHINFTEFQPGSPAKGCQLPGKLLFVRI